MSDTSLCSECSKPFPRREMLEYDGAYVCASCKNLFVQKLKQGVEVGHGPVYAGFWKRTGASLVDALVYLPFMILAQVNTYSIKSLPLALIAVLSFIPYKLIMEARYGATLGKMAMGIRLQTLDGGGVGYGRAVGRNVLAVLTTLVSAVTSVLLFTHPDFASARGFTAVAAVQAQVNGFALVSTPISLLYLAACLAVAVHPMKRGLHDLWAGTVCIRTDQADL